MSILSRHEILEQVGEMAKEIAYWQLLYGLATKELISIYRGAKYHSIGSRKFDDLPEEEQRLLVFQRECQINARDLTVQAYKKAGEVIAPRSAERSIDNQIQEEIQRLKKEGRITRYLVLALARPAMPPSETRRMLNKAIEGSSDREANMLSKTICMLKKQEAKKRTEKRKIEWGERTARRARRK
jgi:hypothetical protein